MNRCQKRKERENRENKGAEISLMGYMKLWHNNARTQCVGELETRFEREGRRKICDENNEKQLYFFRLLRLLWAVRSGGQYQQVQTTDGVASRLWAPGGRSTSSQMHYGD